jgi:hypothetical protein
MLSFLTEIVREKEIRIKDLLEISGMMPISYWISNELTIFAYLIIPMYVQYYHFVLNSLILDGWLFLRSMAWVSSLTITSTHIHNFAIVLF